MFCTGCYPYEFEVSTELAMETKLTSAHLMFKMYVLNTYPKTKLVRVGNSRWILFGIKHRAPYKQTFIWVPKHIEDAMTRQGLEAKIKLDQLLAQLPTAAQLHEFITVNRYVMTYAHYSADGKCTFSPGNLTYAPARELTFNAIIEECLRVMALESKPVSQLNADDAFERF